MPVDLRYASAFLAMLRGSREYDSFVIGSTMLQIRLSVGRAMNGSMTAVLGSGTTSMSDALIGCQPRIDDPSNPLPSSKRSSLSSLVGIEKCCQVPRKSRNLRSTASTLLSFANLSTSFGVCAAMHTPPAVELSLRCWCYSNGVATALASADADDLVDGKHEDLPVTDAAGLGRLLDRLHHLRRLLVADDDLELHLGQEVDDVLCPSVELRVALLPAEPLHLADGQALYAYPRQALLHLVQLEGLDDCLDLFHVVPPVRTGRTRASLTRRNLRL